MRDGTQRRPYFVVNACLAGAVLYFALDLSASGRGVVDFVVIGLAAGAVGWNLLRLCRRLRGPYGARGVWHALRTTLFWVVGLANTVWPGARSPGSWETWLGWVVLAVAAADTVALAIKERAVVAQDSRSEAERESPVQSR